MLSSVTEWILQLHGWQALAIVFAAPALEASTFVGFVFPGEIAVILGGVLASEQRVSLAAVVLAASGGAIIGDSLGYAVGRRWGRRILHGSLGRLVNRRHLDRGEAYLAARGGRAVLLGRFTAALRVLIPGLAGMAGLRYATFLAYNVVGGLAWATVTSLIGYLAGTGWRHAEHVASRVGLAILVLLLLAVVAAWGIRRLRRQSAGLHARLERLAASPPVAGLRRRHPSLAAWLGRRLDPGQPAGLPLTLAATAGIACVWIFAGITQDVVAGEEIARLDPSVQTYAVEHRAAWATPVMRAVSLLGSARLVLPLAVVAALLLTRRARTWWPGAQLVSAVLGALLLAGAVKPVVDRPHPPGPGLAGHLLGSAYPSGHAALAVAAWGMAAVAITGRTRARSIAWTAATAIALTVGAARIYLGAQWLTDILGGYALGGAWLAAVILLRLRRAAVAEPASVPDDAGHAHEVSAAGRRSPSASPGLGPRHR